MRCSKLSLAVAMVLAGCVAAPGPQAPPPPLAADQARIFVYRDNDIYDSLDWVPVTFNGRQVGAVGPGLFFHRDVPPGTYVIDVITESLWPDQSRRVAAHAGETIFAKVGAFRGPAASDSSELPRPTFVVDLRDPDTAHREMSVLRQAIER